MWSTQVKLAWRNLLKNKSYLFINLLGITIAMTCFVLLTMYVQYEKSYDRHHEKSGSTFRIIQQQKGNSYQGTDYFAVAPLPLGEALLKDFAEVEHVTHLNTGQELLVRDDLSSVQNGLYTDSSFFDVFTANIKQGNAKTALGSKDNILVTEALAKKYFGAASPINQVLTFGNGARYTVKGIVENPPKNQHFTYDFIVSYKSQPQYSNDVGFWVSNNYHTYLTLNSPQEYTALEEKMKVYEKITKPAYENEGFAFYPEFKLQPLEDIHLKSNINVELGPNGNIKIINLFTIIAIIILVLAAVNYTNLATSKSALRSKEVGVSKVLGAKRGSLILQYLSESLFVVFTGLLLALLLSYFLLPYFNTLVHREISYGILLQTEIYLPLLVATTLTGLASGVYPAFFLSGVGPLKALKGNFLKSHKEGRHLKNILIVGQFSVAIMLAIASVAVYQQLQFIQNKDLGYSKDQLVHVSYSESEITDNQEYLKNKLMQNPAIKKVSLSSQLPFDVNSQGPITRWEGNLDNTPLYVFRTFVDHDFLDVFEMDIVKGRGFSVNRKSDSTAYLLNEAAVKKLGWSDPIGKEFGHGKVIGVLKDFHIKTFDQAIEPLFMTLRNTAFTQSAGEVVMRINTADYAQTSDYIVKTMNEIVPQVPYEVKIVEDSYMAFYEEERRLGKAFGLFTLLALFIAGMGLFGMVSFQIAQRAREISIRKVLGSSVLQILKLLSKGVFLQLFIAFLIASPIAFYFMEQWLQGYVYRISLHWLTFFGIGVMTMALAFLSITVQSVQAATSNPVKSLRTE